MKKEIKILSIETSCDETAAAVIGDDAEILSSIVSSQADLHAKTNGVVPEVASRAHMEAMIPVVDESLEKAGTNIDDITHVAVTNGPGLIGSLLVGFNAAKAIAYAKNLPLLPVNHIEGHIYSALAQNRVESRKSKVESDVIQFPILALTVSGGHTSLTLMKDHGDYETLGETIDDAAGEAFDKVAKLLDLGYPGGPIVSEFASKFRDRIKNNESGIMNGNHNSEFITHNSIRFPRPLIDKPNFDFSFSGLKTSVLTEVTKNGAGTEARKEEICHQFEEAVVDVLCTKAIRAAKKYKPKAVILAGGVAANKRLREELEKRLSEICVKLLMPEMALCGDNAAMIGLAAYYHIEKGDKYDLMSSTVDSNLAI
ncbi:MAG: tRNA (adenosine(37)-N6)-threonylcarbamoyltransferase complex transferase subunit TsaD [Patescibacteria group bacterium]